MGTETKFFNSAQSGAPVLTGSAGSLTDLLDAVLVNGFGSKSITGGSISGGLATLNVAAPHAFQIDTVIEVAGATPSGLNGQQRVTSITSGSVTFATAATGAVSAAGTVKVASLGWSIAFTGTNKRAYKSIDISSTGVYLRVDDTGTTEARVVGYEVMTDVDTGSGPFPTAAQLSGGGYWGKSATANATARDWYVAGDTKFFYIGVAPNNAIQQFVSWCFGDPVNLRSGDAYSTILMASSTTYVGTGGALADVAYSYRSLSAANCWSPRSYTGLGTSIVNSHVGVMNTQADNYSGCNNNTYGYGWAFPNTCDNGVVLCRKLVYDSASRYRAYFPGLLQTPQFLNDTMPSYYKLDGTGDYAGKRLIAIRCGAANGSVSSGAYGTMFFDLHGSWRA